MNNTRIADDDAALNQVIDIAVSRARPPGAQSFGSAAGVSGVVSNVVVAPPATDGNDEIGITEEGQFFFPFRLGIDWVGKPGAWLQPVTTEYDFGN